MTEDNQSYLRFSVEESVWFQRGQEVDDLVSISLYPDITIEEHDQYITIRGALQLTGEYRIHVMSSNEMEETQGYPNGRFMNEVKTREDGISELKHRFPVDITIPKNRIQNLDEVYISIDSFDYERPSNDCLQLVADLSISGIYNSAQQKDVKQYDDKDNGNEELDFNEESIERDGTNSSTLFKYEEEDDDVLEVIKQENHSDFSHPVSFEAYHNVDDDTDMGVGVDMADNDADLFTTIEVEARKEAYQDYVSAEDFSKDVQKEAISQNEIKNRVKVDLVDFEADLYTPIEVEARKEVDRDDVQDVGIGKVVQKDIQPQIEIKSRDEKEEWSYPQRIDTIHDNKDKSQSAIKETNNHEKEAQAKGKRDENALYLTNIFAKDENQDFTSLKMYIVQTGDSLNTVSERYDVTVQQLLRVNHLDQERTIQGGQILYIPVQEKSKSF